MTDCVYTCPNVEWFKFTKCTIKTCSNWTPVYESRCIGIERVVPIGSKVITDAELAILKFPSSKITPRYTSVLRKKAQQNIEKVLILKELIQFISINFKPKRKEFYPHEYKKAVEFPLALKELGYKVWMIDYLTQPVLDATFSQHSGKCCEVTIEQLLSTKKIGIAHELTKETISRRSPKGRHNISVGCK